MDKHFLGGKKQTEVESFEKCLRILKDATDHTFFFCHILSFSRFQFSGWIWRGRHRLPSIAPDIGGYGWS